MRNRLNILFFCALAMVATGFISCSEDDLGPSIFDTNDYPLDRTEYCFPLDTFLKVNFLEPYNVKFIYRMEDIGSDMTKNLTPARYEKSIELAVLAKYLWYDVYAKYGTDRFLKENSPRIIHVIGSKNLNPSQGTEILGVAEGGLKISLYNVNNLNYADIDNMNEYFFKTMHHEFGHILNQNENRPTEFDLISNTFYNTAGWQDTPDSVALGQGFVSKYASSQAREDWVEVIANYIVKDTVTWENMLNGATKSWELATDVPAERFASYFVNGTTSVDADPTTWRLKPGIHRDSVGYWHRNGTTSGDVVATYQVVRKYIQRDASGYAVPDAEGNIVYLSIVDKTNQEIAKTDFLEYYKNLLNVKKTDELNSLVASLSKVEEENYKDILNYQIKYALNNNEVINKFGIDKDEYNKNIYLILDNDPILKDEYINLALFMKNRGRIR